MMALGLNYLLQAPGAEKWSSVHFTMHQILLTSLVAAAPNTSSSHHAGGLRRKFAASRSRNVSAEKKTHSMDISSDDEQKHPGILEFSPNAASMEVTDDDFHFGLGGGLNCKRTPSLSSMKGNFYLILFHFFSPLVNETLPDYSCWSLSLYFMRWRSGGGVLVMIHSKICRYK